MHCRLQIDHYKILIALSGVAFLMLVSRHLLIRTIVVRTFCRLSNLSNLILLALLLSACGNKGPLYLPQPEPAAYTSQSGATE